MSSIIHVSNTTLAPPAHFLVASSAAPALRSLVALPVVVDVLFGEVLLYEGEGLVCMWGVALTCVDQVYITVFRVVLPR